MLRWLPLLLCMFLIVPQGDGAEPEEITSGLALHNLSRSEAAKGLPLHITGVVTDAGMSSAAGFIIDDHTRGVFVHRDKDLKIADDSKVDDPLSVLKVGMKVEVKGTTDSGLFAPQVELKSLRILGMTNVPNAKPVIITDLLTGSYDCQRVSLRGVLQNKGGRVLYEQRAQFVIASHEGRCQIILAETGMDEILSLVDAEVEVQGVCCSFFTPRGELAGVRLHVSSLKEIKVLVPAPVDPFSVPEISIRELRPFSVEPLSLHRKQFRGTVTLTRSGEFFYVQNGSRGVRVYSQQLDPLPVNSEVIVSGFIEEQRAMAEVRQAVYRVIGTSEAVKPLPVMWREIIGKIVDDELDATLDVDGSLISLNGRLLQIETMEQGFRLFVQSGGSVVSAEIDNKSFGGKIKNYRLGSDVKLTGVCSTELSAPWPLQEQPYTKNFSLLLRTPDDIQITRLASWWTAERLWKALAGLFAALILAFIWAFYLHRKVEEKRLALAENNRASEAAKVEFAATMSERERLAADLHDTLEQALTGVAFQLETMHRLRDHPPELSQRHLFLARQILSGSREDVRRSVWNLRSNVLEGRMLREALVFIAEGFIEGSTIKITSGGTGDEVELPDLIAGNLLMLAKESITNALKHANPTTIHLAVDYEPERVTLTVTDDGCGFDQKSAKGPHQGHFGLQGMRERALRLGGELEITSKPGQGTRIVIRVNPSF